MRLLFILLIVGIWIGLLVGLSFIEAPLKFQAPNITLKLGLGIGQIMFYVLNKIEIAFALLLIGLYYPFGKQIGYGLGAALIALYALLIIQTFVLLPVLDHRATLIIQNQEVVHSYHHIFYIVGECLKLFLLFFVFFKTVPLLKQAI